MENTKNIDELNRIIYFYKMQVYKKNIIIKQLKNKLNTEEDMRRELLSKINIRSKL